MTDLPELAMHLADTDSASGFEASLSYDLKLDQAFCVPLWKSGLDPLPAIIPVVINVLQPPPATMARCLQLGSVLAEAIRIFPVALRVAILASEELSHSVGEPAMGRIDDAFDRECGALLADSDPARLLAFLTDARVAQADSGAAELWS